MEISGKIKDGTSNEPLNFGSDPWPWQRFALYEYTLRAKVCTLPVLRYYYLYINVCVTLGVVAAYLFFEKITVALLIISKKLNFAPVTRKDGTLS